MARRRMIDPAIWQSEDFSKLSLLARLVFIGMFSLSDDEGKGRAKPVYLKSIIFPYDEDIRVADIDKTLSEIGSKMSVTLYSHNGNRYYKFDHWSKWQRVDKPQPSNFPNPDDRTIPESVENDSGMIPEPFLPKGKEEKRKEIKEKENIRARAFTPPSVEEVTAYCKERGNRVDPNRFVDFYTSKGWMVGKTKMKDWKACVRNWERDEQRPIKPGPTTYHTESSIDMDKVRAIEMADIPVYGEGEL